MLTTVLAAVVAASIVAVLANLALTDLRTASAAQSLDAARTDARAAAASFVAELNTNPTGYLDQVAETERARVCIADPSAPVIQPTAAWPRRCGTAWTYTDPVADADVRIEVTPPGTAGAELIVRAFARSGVSSAAQEMTLTRSSASTWTVLSDADLPLSSVNSQTSVRTSARGSYYSAGTLDPTTSNVTYDRSLFAAEGGVPAAGGPENNIRATAGNPELSDVREFVPNPRSTAQLRASVETTRAEVCRAATSTNIDVDGSDQSLELCLQRGQSLRDTAGTARVVPDTATAYLITSEVAAGKPVVRVWTSNKQMDVGPTAGNLLSGASAAVAAGNHPGGLQFWTELGTFHPPVTGTVFTDADVQLGVCPTFHSGSACATLPGSDGPGMRVQMPLTVIAGTPSAPASVWFGSPVRAGTNGERIGAVAYGSVLFPYWARPTNGALSVNASIVAFGGGTSSDVPDIHVYPADIDSNAAANRGGALTVRGSIAAPRVGFLPSIASSNPLFATTFVEPVGTRDAEPPNMPSFDRRWDINVDRPIPPSDVCPTSCDNFLGGGSSGDGNDTTAPGAPTGLTATSAVGSVTLTWTRSDDTDVAEYVIRYSPTAGGASATALLPADDCAPSTCSRTITGLTNGARYDFTVIAVDTSGNRSPSSAKVTATPNDVPATPTGLAANAEGVYSVRLTWARPSGSAPDGYRVIRDGAVVATVATETWLDASMAAGSSPSYQVLAYNAAGESEKSAAVTVALMPGSPTGLTVENTGPATGDPTATLTWGISPGTVTGYRVQRSNTPARPASGTYIASPGPGATSYVDSSAPAGRLTYYWVYAYNAQGDSITATNQVMVRPAAPTGLAVATSGSAVASWDPAPAAQQIDKWAVWLNGELVTEVPNTGFSEANRPTVTLTGATGSGSVYVVAHNSGGGTRSATANYTLTPSTPTGFKFTGATETTISFDWDAAATATGYEVQRVGVSAPVAVAGTSHTWSSLAASVGSVQTYQFRVRACNDNGCSPYTPYSPMTTGGFMYVAASHLTTAANATGAPGTFTVPAGVKQLRANVAGGGGAEGRRCGAAGWTGTPGAGGIANATFGVTPEATITYWAGRRAFGPYPGYPGGGNPDTGGVMGSAFCPNAGTVKVGGAGGGLSGMQLSAAQPLLFAGGGGGAANLAVSIGTPGNGGNGGGGNGATGSHGTLVGFGTYLGLGGGGGQASGAAGAAGRVNGNGTVYSSNTQIGSLIGTVGAVASGRTGGSTAWPAGAGGGGYAGGGSAGRWLAEGLNGINDAAGGGGGGGAGYIVPGATNTSTATAAANQNGYVRICWHGSTACGATAPAFVP